MKDWFINWFNSEQYLDVYSHRDESDAKKIVDLIISTTNIKIGSSVLDAACGAGRHSIHFATLGYNVSAFDLSENLLKYASKSAEEKQLLINFFRSDIRTVELKKKYDLIVNLFTSFGYFDDDDDNFRFVKNAFNNLVPSGYYVLDYFNITQLKNSLIPFSVKQIGSKKIIEERKLIGNFVVKNITIEDDEAISNFKEKVKLYEVQFLREKLIEIGFKIYAEFGDYDGNRFSDLESSRIIIIAQK